MPLSITDCKITGSRTMHWAELAHLETEPGAAWLVSWLPGRVLDHGQAVTAMMIAETASSTPEPGGPDWPQVDGWLAELGLARQALAAAASRPKRER